MTLVVDASALAVALLGRSSGAAGLRNRLAGEQCHAPHLIDAEVGNVLRRQVIRDELPAADAKILLIASERLIDHRHQMTGTLAITAWAMRDNVTFYDGLYIALAAALSAPLITADVRLANAPRLNCEIELIR
jgi:predicted nucleic acid-binding protein